MTVNNNCQPTVYNVGYLGEGKYKRTVNGKATKQYEEWVHMLQRAFDEKLKLRYPTYKDVIIDERFYCFQDYCYWRECNYYEIENEQMHLDKDILFKGNKIYSPDACIFVPERVNNLFIKRNNSRGDLPIGVCYHKQRNKYQANCNILNGKKYLGLYSTPEEAFLAYKTFKEQYIKEVADEYRNKIPKELYEAMYRWEVEITD